MQAKADYYLKASTSPPNVHFSISQRINMEATKVRHLMEAHANAYFNPKTRIIRKPSLQEVCTTAPETRVVSPSPHHSIHPISRISARHAFLHHRDEACLDSP